MKIACKSQTLHIVLLNLLSSRLNEFPLILLAYTVSLTVGTSICVSFHGINDKLISYDSDLHEKEQRSRFWRSDNQTRKWWSRLNVWKRRFYLTKNSNFNWRLFFISSSEISMDKKGDGQGWIGFGFNFNYSDNFGSNYSYREAVISKNRRKLFWEHSLLFLQILNALFSSKM